MDISSLTRGIKEVNDRFISLPVHEFIRMGKAGASRLLDSLPKQQKVRRSAVFLGLGHHSLIKPGLAAIDSFMINQRSSADYAAAQVQLHLASYSKPGLFDLAKDKAFIVPGPRLHRVEPPALATRPGGPLTGSALFSGLGYTFAP